MLDKTFAERFAAEWIAAWNSRDLDRVLSHYTDDFEMSSPYIAQVAGEASGKLKARKLLALTGRALSILSPICTLSSFQLWLASGALLFTIGATAAWPLRFSSLVPTGKWLRLLRTMHCDPWLQ